MTDSEAATRQRQEEALQFMQDYFGLAVPEPKPGEALEGHTSLTRQNQPEFQADAPWRLEPDCDRIPLLFIVREPNLTGNGLGPWHLQELRVEHKVGDVWLPLLTLMPAALPYVRADGSFERDFWFHTISLERTDLHVHNHVISLRVVFEGRFPPYAELDPQPPRRYLQVHLADQPLPLGRAAAGNGHGNGNGRQTWFYGDIHYHSAHTNDVWEFGNPVDAARLAAQAIGLDWLAITDHSCDLDDPDVTGSSLSRWERLKSDLEQAAASDTFRLLLGEEVTLLNTRGGYVHMLALGPLDSLIPGGFWSQADDVVKVVAGWINEVAHEQGGYPADAVERLFGPVLELDEVLACLPPGALAFAAHPYDPAQPPFFNSTWNKRELKRSRLAGHEFWNGRTRRQTDLLEAPTDNPFDQPEWNDLKKTQKSDRDRIKRLRERVEKEWEGQLCLAVDHWPEGRDRPALWPVFVGGSDAHGDFNYSVGVGWDYRQHRLISDNALGRVRTVVHLPDHDGAAPAQADLLAALGRGACVVTDGPLLEVAARQDGQVAHLGDLLVLDGGGEARLEVVTHTAGEFGPVTEVEVVTYLQGQPGKKPKVTVVASGQEQVLALEGRRGYCRLQAWTTGPGPDGERFCCFTNPIWLRLAAGQAHTLRVRVRQGTV